MDILNEIKKGEKMKKMKKMMISLMIVCLLSLCFVSDSSAVTKEELQVQFASLKSDLQTAQTKLQTAQEQVLIAQRNIDRLAGAVINTQNLIADEEAKEKAAEAAEVLKASEALEVAVQKEVLID